MALWIVAYPYGTRQTRIKKSDRMLGAAGVDWVLETTKQYRYRHLLRQDQSLNLGSLDPPSQPSRSSWTVVGLCKVRPGKLWEGSLTDFDDEERMMHRYWRRPLDAYTVSLSEVWAMREPTSISTCRHKPRREGDADPEAQEHNLSSDPRASLTYPTTAVQERLLQATLECVRGPRKGETHRADAVLTRWGAGDWRAGEYPGTRRVF